MIWQRDHFSRCVLSDWDSGRSPFGQVVDENAVKQLVLDSPHLPSRFFVSWSPWSVNIVQCQADQEEEELQLWIPLAKVRIQTYPNLIPYMHTQQLTVFRSTETDCKQIKKNVTNSHLWPIMNLIFLSWRWRLLSCVFAAHHLPLPASLSAWNTPLSKSASWPSPQPCSFPLHLPQEDSWCQGVFNFSHFQSNLASCRQTGKLLSTHLLIIVLCLLYQNKVSNNFAQIVWCVIFHLRKDTQDKLPEYEVNRRQAIMDDYHQSMRYIWEKRILYFLAGFLLIWKGKYGTHLIFSGCTTSWI